jgi:uncharacterized tellurite resistance protein B-like protein
MGLFNWLSKREKQPTQRVNKTSSSRKSTKQPVPPASRPSSHSSKKITASSSRIAVSQQAAAHAKWIKPGQRIKIHGYEINGGMLYVGYGLKTAPRQTEPSLIDPELTVSVSKRGAIARDLNYWPSYNSIAPEDRATYLAWLADGRRNPLIPIGYVFLFMYGLERRVLVDIFASGSLASELPAIRFEMTGLLKYYGPQNNSFRHYATNFIDVIDVLTARYTNQTLLPPELRPERFSVPPTLPVELGRRALAGAAIPSDFALSWAWYLPDNTPRTPATRCRQEFAKLFKIRFDEQYPNGLLVKPGKAKIRLAYTPASAGLHFASNLPLDLPDIFSQRAPGRKLIELSDNVTNELEAYSRWLGRNPDGVGSLAATALLPPELVSQAAGLIKQLLDWANGQLGPRSAIKVPGAELLRMWPSATADKISKSDAVALAQLLGNLGFGIEPDVRFGGSPVARDSPLVLFRTPVDSPHAATPAYSAATVLVQLAAAVGAADGEVSYQEIDHLGEHLESSLSLLPAEKTRLQAHLMWLWTADIKLSSLKNRLEGLNESVRQGIGSLMISIAAADGVVSPGEVTILTKIYQMLGLSPSLVTSHLHSSLTGSNPSPAKQPVVVRPGGTPVPGYRIPTRPEQSGATPAPNSFSLDVAAIQRKLAETAEVSVLLGNLFVEDAEISSSFKPPSAPAPSVGDSISLVTGMDAAHSLLVRAVAKRAEWSRADFEDLAAEYHLMPDGAIDVLNEAAYEAAGEPIIEGDDLLTINKYALEELLK